MSSISTTLPADLTEALPPILLRSFVAGLRDLYDGVPNSVENPGFDGTCFGIAVYRMARVELVPAAERTGHQVEVVVEDNALLYVVNGISFTCQRVARTREVDIARAFPRNYRAGLRRFRDIRSGQGFFDFMREECLEEPPLVLAHVGNDEDGLLAVYLCRPAVVENGHIRTWEFAVELYREHDVDDGQGARPESLPAIPPVEDIDRAAVLPKRQPKEGTE